VNEENETGGGRPSSEWESPLPALIVAILPLALLLVEACLNKLGLLGWKLDSAVLFLVCASGITCCFKGSFMLFARRTPIAILSGIAFMILKGVIAYYAFFAAIFAEPGSFRNQVAMILRQSPYRWLPLAGIAASLFTWTRLARRDHRLVLICVAALLSARIRIWTRSVRNNNSRG